MMSENLFVVCSLEHVRQENDEERFEFLIRPDGTLHAAGVN